MREVHVGWDLKLIAWCPRVCAAVAAQMGYETTLTVAHACQGRYHTAVSLSHITDVNEVPTTGTTKIIELQESPVGGCMVEEEDERVELVANADAWYHNLTTILRPQLTLYSVP